MYSQKVSIIQGEKTKNAPTPSQETSVPTRKAPKSLPLGNKKTYKKKNPQISITLPM
jgi:hypothetical protein